MALEKRLVLRAVSAMLNMPLTKMDKLVLDAGKELSLRITDELGIHCHLSLQYQLEIIYFATAKQLKRHFIWRTLIIVYYLIQGTDILPFVSN